MSKVVPPKDTNNGRFLPMGDQPMAKRAVSVRLPVDVEAAISQLSDRTGWLRRVITEAAERELFNDKRID